MIISSKIPSEEVINNSSNTQALPNSSKTSTEEAVLN